MRTQPTGALLCARNCSRAVLALSAALSLGCAGDGSPEAETSGGSVSVVFAKGNSKGGRIESSGGGINVRVDPASNLDLHAETSGGSVSCTIPILTVGEHDRSEITGKIGKGGTPLEVSTSGGSIRITSTGNAS